jgi:predicted ester cyclase
MTILRKTLIVAVSTCALVTACKKDEAKTAEEPAPTAGKTTEATAMATGEATGEGRVDTTARFRECWAAYNSKEEDAFKNCYADSAEGELVDYVPPTMARGPEEMLAVAKDVWKKFPDIKAEAQLVLVNGPNVAAIVYVDGTNTGPLDDKPATGKSISIFQGQIASLNPEGKVVTDHHWIDQTSMMHQLGMQPSERSPDSETPWAKSIWVVAENSSVEKANRELAEQLGQLAEKDDRAGYFSHVADDIGFRYVGDKNVVNGIEAYKKAFAMWEDMADYKSAPVSLWAAGDWVVAVHDTTATLKEDMEGIPGSKGKDVKTKQLEFMAFADGKLKTHWVFENTAAYAAQLGQTTSK